MNDVFIHVGLQKTGTTFLQEKVFKKLDVNYIRYLDEKIYNGSLDENKPLLLSNEDLSGYPHCVYRKDADVSRWRIARNLSVLFPNAKIILGLREESSWLRSLYREAVRQGLVLGFQDFKNMFNMEMLDFQKYVDFLKNLFDDVYVYYFEDLKKDYMSVVEGICGFIGVPVPSGVNNVLVNPSLADWQLPGFRLLNRFFKSNAYHPTGLFPRTWFNYVYNFIREDGVQKNETNEFKEV